MANIKIILTNDSLDAIQLKFYVKKVIDLWFERNYF